MTYDEVKTDEWKREAMLRIRGGRAIANLRCRSSSRHGRLSQRAFCAYTKFPEGTLKSLEKPGTVECRGATAVALAEALAFAIDGDPATEFARFVASNERCESLRLRCRFLVPFDLPARCHADALGPDAEAFSINDICGRVKRCGPEVSLHAFPYEIGVWVLEHEANFDCVTSYAAFRRSLYREINKSGTHRLNTLTRQLRAGSGVAEAKGTNVYYVLSIVELLNSPWSGSEMHSGLKLLSWPSLLLPHGVPDDDLSSGRSLEASYISAGLRHEEFCSFSLDRVLSGYASWSGVSMCVHDPVRAFSFDDLTMLEVALQSVWAYTHRCGASIGQSGSRDTYLAEVDMARSLIARLTAVGPRDDTLRRLAAEALITTSRIATTLPETIQITKSSRTL